MASWLIFSLIPETWLDKIGPLAMLLVGFLVEKEFVSRPATFANTIALNTYFAIRGVTNIWLVVYADIGLAIGIVALFSYWIRESLPQEFYVVNWLYCSIIVGLIIMVV